MPSVSSKADNDRGMRLAKWLERVAPDVPKYLRGETVFGVPRQTVHSWIKGSDISNEGIGRILEIGGLEALTEILGVVPGASTGEDLSGQAGPAIHGKGVRFWYKQYVRVKARDILEGTAESAAVPDHAQEALKKADVAARRKAMAMQATGSKKPRGKSYDYS